MVTEALFVQIGIFCTQSTLLFVIKGLHTGREVAAISINGEMTDTLPPKFYLKLESFNQHVSV